MDTISSKEFAKIFKNNSVCVIDVRQPEEYKQKRLPRSKLVPLNQIENGNMTDIPKDQMVYIICRSGRRSLVAVSILKAYGYEDVISIDGGIIECDEIAI